MEATEEKAKVYQLLVDMGLKILCTLVGLGAFIAVLIVMITSKEEWRVKAVYGVIEVIILSIV